MPGSNFSDYGWIGFVATFVLLLLNKIAPNGLFGPIVALFKSKQEKEQEVVIRELDSNLNQSQKIIDTSLDEQAKQADWMRKQSETFGQRLGEIAAVLIKIESTLTTIEEKTVRMEKAVDKATEELVDTQRTIPQSISLLLESFVKQIIKRDTERHDTIFGELDHIINAISGLKEYSELLDMARSVEEINDP